MKTLTAVLIIAALLESTVLPINLVLIILICRSYLRADRSNLFLAFAFGLFWSQLNLAPLGATSLIYLLIVAAVQTLSKTRLAGNQFLIVPLSVVLLLVNQLVQFYFTHQMIQILKIILESLIALPVFYLVKIWEERFIVRKEIKLRV